jgi:ribosome-binding factor A
MARVNEVVREVIADELERLSDPRLGLVTVTGVDVSADLRHATVYYSALDSGREQHKRARRRSAPSSATRPEREMPRGEAPQGEGELDVTPTADAQAAFKEQTAVALRSAAPHIRTALGRQVRMKYTPELHFREDPAIEQGQRVEAIIRSLHSRDERDPE